MLALLPFLLAGCGAMPSVSLWPFGESRSAELNRTPENATEYRCDGGLRFYVRTLEGGAVWLILPEREVRLAKAGGGARYAAGRLALEIDGSSATLADPPATYTGCKVPAPQAK